MTGLDDPEHAAFAWARYRRIMRWMALVALVCVAGTLAMVWFENGFIPFHLAIATTLGIGGTVLLTAALMGLLFLSSGTGHDEQVHDPLRGEIDIDD